MSYYYYYYYNASGVRTEERQCHELLYLQSFFVEFGNLVSYVQHLPLLIASIQWPME